ncbi:urease accessory protein UreD [Metabacillus sp. Hm71]|uniref:urease accessory protein UreD n=1 Tax=Metabacillus sp. Hm71 TaxID=3450743 RepID=UPI003F41CA6A
MSHTGFLDITAKKKHRKTVISSCYYEGALKITRPVYLEDNNPSIFLIHVGGGYVDGDSYLTNLIIEKNAELSVTTQSSTKVYKTPKQPVLQRMNIKLAQGGILEYLPDPLIAYEGARFTQETIVQLENGACLFYSDIITPGWAKDGSFFRYKWIRSKLKVYKGKKLVLLDHTWLEPDGDMGGIMQMEKYTHIGTFLIIHDHVDKSFLNNLYEKLETLFPDVHFGLSALPESGVILRILAFNTGIIDKMIHYAHSIARGKLLGKENIVWRKY